MLRLQLPVVGLFFSFLQLACCVNNINYEQQSLTAASAITSPHSQFEIFPSSRLTSPPFLPLQMLLSLQMLFGKLSPAHIHGCLSSSSLPSQMLFGTCLPVPVFLFSFLLSSASLHPAPLTLLPSLSRFSFSSSSRFCLSLHLLRLPISLPFSTPHSFLQLPRFPSPRTRKCSNSSFPLLFFFFSFSPFPSTHHPSISFLCPDVLWTEMISPAEIMKLKSVPRQNKYLLFWAGGGRVTVICSQPR